MSNSLLDLLGKQIIDEARDNPILMALSIINAKNQREYNKEKGELFSNMEETEREMVKKLIYEVVDMVLHNLLLTFENSDFATINLSKDGKTIKDIRNATSGGLQGYIFEWAEKFSKQPLSHERI